MEKLRNVAVFFLVLIGLKNIFVGLPIKGARTFEHFYNMTIHPTQVVIHHSLSFLLGALMLLLAWRVIKRVRLAWAIEIGLLCGSIALQLFHYHRFNVPIILVEVFILVALVLCHKDFTRPVGRTTVKKSLVLVGISFALVLINATIGIFLLRSQMDDMKDIVDAFLGSLQLLLSGDTGSITGGGNFIHFYVVSLVAINWACILSSLFLLLTPLVYNPIMKKKDKERVRELVMKYGQNSMAYLSLEDDKSIFFSEKKDGFCAYTVVSDVFVVLGDMVCPRDDGKDFLAEILAYCRKNHYSLLFLNVNQYFLREYEEGGCEKVKIGEECVIDLEGFTLAGGKMAKVRAGYNHGEKAGLSVVEYKPKEMRDNRMEEQIEEITAQWLESKGGYEMQFTLGGTGLRDPLDRRYFCAVDGDGDVQGFVVFLPYVDGWMADVTRRREGAPGGTIEYIVIKALMQFKEEGSKWGSMGLSPLYNVTGEDRATITEKTFAYIYDNLNGGYGFKTLHQSKEKYAPLWQTRYLVFSPGPFSPQYAYALVKCQMKSGIVKMVLSGLFKK